MSVIDTLTAGEMGIAEQRSGQSITSLEDPSAPKMSLLTALAWVVMKREKSNTTYAEAEKLTLKEIMDLLGLGETDDDPKEK